MGIYERLIEKRKDSKELRECMEQTVEELLLKKTDVEHPGMLLGDIQSGKTRGFTGIIALAFDKKYDVAVVLTKGTKALVKQTVQRFKSEFEEFEQEDILRIFDVMEIPDDLNEYVIDKQKLILVVKKEDDNIRRLTSLFFVTYPALSKKSVLIVDDEADFVSIGYRRVKNESGEREIDLNVISKQLSDFRKSLADGSDYLQVTATPYSLYLQPETIALKDTIFSPMRPKFTKLLPIHDKYIGSNYYFEESKKPKSPAQYLFQAIEEDELKTLSDTHGKIFNNILNSPSIKSLRSAILNYIVGSCIRTLQSEKEGVRHYKSSFIIHTETSRKKHENQAAVIKALIDALKTEGVIKSTIFRETLEKGYSNLSLSISLTSFYLPGFDDVFEKACEYIRYITIRKINSDNDVLGLLNLSGELKLESPLNVFVGGQILDRGITIQNLIGFFYGRNPARMQQDTVMQHARIFGARSLEDMAVTRLYTTNRIYESMRRMHESDKALRRLFEEGGSNQRVAFVQKSEDGKIVPCSPNKLLISNTVTLKPGGTLTVYGFQTKAKTHIHSIVDDIESTLKSLSKDNITAPFLITVEQAVAFIDLIYSTFESEQNIGGATKEEFKAALEYASKETKNAKLRGHVYCFSNEKPKKSARFKENQRGLMYNDVAYDGRTDAKNAKEVADEIPCLFLSFQSGLKDLDWKDAQFYWPVLFIQQKLVTCIFTTEADPIDEEEDLTDDTGPMKE